MDVFPVKNRESIITTPTIRAPDQSAVFAGYTQLSHILACVAGVLVWKEIGEIKACENVLGARGESLPSFSFPFALFINSRLLARFSLFLLEDVFLYFFRIDDDASKGACVLPAWSVPDVGHGV